MEEILESENLKRAYQRVVQNKGAAGVDKLSVEDLKPYLAANWKRIRSELLEGKYVPKEVRRVEIPKSTGGVRQLGIPSVIDRFIQQALQQVLQKHLDAGFSQYSYGFRPGKSQHEAVKQAQEYVCSGLSYVVDMDLEKFFDTVNHDVLMGRLAARITDKRVLKLIRAFLNSGMMEDGLMSPTEEGVPQGGPLSPLLSNLLLDELDKELESRKLHFVRYADDCNIYVSSQRAGERVMESITKFLAKKLRLKVNAEKSAVGRPWERKFLGFTFTRGKSPKRRIAPAALLRLKQKLKEMTQRNRGNTLEQVVQELKAYMTGWYNYFKFCETPTVLNDIEQWLRRRLRCMVWKRWKHSSTRFQRLRELGLSVLDATEGAGNGSRGPWRMAASPPMHKALSKKYFRSLGLPDFRLIMTA
ncbi:MAG: group II intron reverse transcriptase/maturase [Cyanobacteria bacterium SZAS LIN-5]|nr:group II intron reverse transcriptase/maturase [Cyanobacteria bacterium SZAS LIN-5]